MFYHNSWSFLKIEVGHKTIDFGTRVVCAVPPAIQEVGGAQYSVAGCCMTNFKLRSYAQLLKSGGPFSSYHTFASDCFLSVCINGNTMNTKLGFIVTCAFIDVWPLEIVVIKKSKDGWGGGRGVMWVWLHFLCLFLIVNVLHQKWVCDLIFCSKGAWGHLSTNQVWC